MNKIFGITQGFNELNETEHDRMNIINKCVPQISSEMQFGLCQYLTRQSNIHTAIRWLTRLTVCGQIDQRLAAICCNRITAHY